MKNQIIILLLTFFLFYSGCIADSFCDEAGVDFLETVTFQVVDEDNGKDLFEELEVYDKDSIRLLINNIDILSKECADDRSCQFQIDNRRLDLTTYNDSLYFLHLNANEVDTIQMFAVADEHFCLKTPQSKIVNFIYNGDTLFNRNIGGRDFIEIKK